MVKELKQYFTDRARFERKIHSIAIDLILTISLQMGYTDERGRGGFPPRSLSP